MRHGSSAMPPTMVLRPTDPAYPTNRLKTASQGSGTVAARGDIDLLSRHYGFTDEELGFIINYDIKYRMGQAAEGEDD